jgi:membrane associated rhomboid family serine protease
MRQPPPLTRAYEYPVTSALAVAASVVSVAWWGSYDIARFLMDASFWPYEPWRVLKSVLPHVNFLHLAFNLYWLWILGALVERKFGPLRTLGIYVLLAAGSGAAEYAFVTGGVGLSGVVYGLWGMLCVLDRLDERFDGAMDRETSFTFVGWFFFCILLTWTQIMSIANVAHGAGAVLGLLLGCAIGFRRRTRWASAGATATATACLLLAAAIGRPYVNVTSDRQHDLTRRGQVALTRGDNARAAALFQRAVDANRTDGRLWCNLGLALERLNRNEDAEEAFEHAAAASGTGTGTELRKWLSWRTATRAWVLEQALQFRASARDYERAVMLDSANGWRWYDLGRAQQTLGNAGEAHAAMQRAGELSAAEPDLRRKLAQWKSSLAVEADAAGAVANAACLFEEAVAFDEQSAVDWFNLGVCYSKLGRTHDAIAALERAVKLNPSPAHKESLAKLRPASEKGEQ